MFFETLLKVAAGYCSSFVTLCHIFVRCFHCTLVAITVQLLEYAADNEVYFWYFYISNLYVIEKPSFNALQRAGRLGARRIRQHARNLACGDLNKKEVYDVEFERRTL